MKREAGAHESWDLPIIDSGRLAPPCRTACPADMDIPGFLRAIASGDNAEAWRIIYRDNLFPSVLGWICPRPCEGACRLGAGGAPVPVCQIKRWVTASQAPPPDLVFGRMREGPVVAVIGAGPAGLAAAHDLAIAGAHVTVFDREARPGGLLTGCIPTFRMPLQVAHGDIERILALGIPFEAGFVLRGRHDLEQLMRERGFAAVVLATGPGDDRIPEVSGWRESRSTWTAIAFLREARKGTVSLRGRRVVVVGGGNGAIDAARAALRADAREVRILYRRGRADMPAFPEEIEAAEFEDVHILPWTIVTEISWDGETLRGVHCASTRKASSRVRSVKPSGMPGSDHFRPCDVVIFAIGQTPTVGDEVADLPGVFSCGTSADEVGTVVTAIASGRRAATQLLDTLHSAEPFVAAGGSGRPVGTRTGDPIEGAEAVTRAPAEPPPAAARQNGQNGASTAGSIPEIPPVPEEALHDLLHPEIAAQAARRCLACDHLLALDPGLCILCGKCAEVCASDALAWRPATENEGHGWRLLIHDSDCQRCGDCVVICPAGALGWTPWTHPNRSHTARSIIVPSPEDDSSS